MLAVGGSIDTGVVADRAPAGSLESMRCRTQVNACSASRQRALLQSRVGVDGASDIAGCEEDAGVGVSNSRMTASVCLMRRHRGLPHLIEVTSSLFEAAGEGDFERESLRSAGCGDDA